jgi:hypothetical protein
MVSTDALTWSELLTRFCVLAILLFQQILFVTTQLVDYTSTNFGSAKASPKLVPHPPTVAPDLRLFYEVSQ